MVASQVVIEQHQCLRLAIECAERVLLEKGREPTVEFGVARSICSVTGDRAALPAFSFDQHVEIDGAHPVHQRGERHKFFLCRGWRARMVAPDAAHELWREGEPGRSRQVAHSLDSACVLLRAAIQVHAYPVDGRVGLHTRDVKRRSVLEGDIMKDRDALDASLAQHLRDAYHAIMNIMFFVLYPVAMQGNVRCCANMAVTRRGHAVEIVIQLSVDGVELRDGRVALAQEAMVRPDGGRTIIGSVGLVMEHEAGFVVALRGHDAALWSLVTRDERAYSVEPPAHRLVKFRAGV